MNKRYDLVIRGGSIVDGTGAKAYDGDVAISDGVIAATGAIDGSGEAFIYCGTEQGLQTLFVALGKI